MIEVRRADRTDAEHVRRCLSLAFEPYRETYTVGAFADTVPSLDGIRRRLEEMTVLVATERGEIVGTIGLQLVNETEGHLRGMAARPDYLGTGVARRLLAHAEAELRDRGCTRISLDTTAPLTRAIRFYERHGFRATGIVRDFFGMTLFEYVKILSE